MNKKCRPFITSVTLFFLLNFKIIASSSDYGNWSYLKKKEIR